MGKFERRGDRVRKQMLNFIIEYITTHGYAPSIREIGRGVGLKSTSCVHTHILRMKDLGMIESDEESSPRAIRIPGYKFVKVEEGKDGKE